MSEAKREVVDDGREAREEKRLTRFAFVVSLDIPGERQCTGIKFRELSNYVTYSVSWVLTLESLLRSPFPSFVRSYHRCQNAKMYVYWRVLSVLCN